MPSRNRWHLWSFQNGFSINQTLITFKGTSLYLCVIQSQGKFVGLCCKCVPSLLLEVHLHHLHSNGLYLLKYGNTSYDKEIAIRHPSYLPDNTMGTSCGLILLFVYFKVHCYISYMNGVFIKIYEVGVKKYLKTDELIKFVRARLTKICYFFVFALPWNQLVISMLLYILNWLSYYIYVWTNPN